MLCDPCCRMVEGLLDREWSDLGENVVRAVVYHAASRLETRCFICRRLFEHMESHIASRHVSWVDSGQDTAKMSLVIEAIPRGTRDGNSNRKTGDPAFTFEPWQASSSFGPGATALMAKTPELLIVPESTGDPHCLALASKWLELCMKNHPNCNRRSEAGYRPPRLLRLDGENVCLVSSSDLSPDAPIHYAALSYCWGESPSFLRLSHMNESQLRRGISLDGLPPLMRDVLDTVKKLSLKYIWIDSLCILQDGPGSEADWELHVREMRNVYQNCLVNIAAASASCPDEPLFQRRCPNEIIPASFKLGYSASDGDNQERIFTVRHYNRLEQQLSEGALSKRGWVFQERVMSPRCVSFGKKQIHWECSMTTACEAFPQGYAPCKRLDFDIIPSGSIRDDDATNSSLTGRKETTVLVDLDRHTITEIYTEKSLSMPAKDKLVAVAAIMEALNTVQGVPHDEYICGFLRRDLPHSLYWCMPNQRLSYDAELIGTSKYRAPSWSWAAYDYRCIFFHYEVKPFPYTSLEGAHWSLVDQQNSYGQVSAAKLVLCTRLIAIDRPAAEPSEGSGIGRASIYNVSIKHPDYSWPLIDSAGSGHSPIYMNELDSCCVTLATGGVYNVHLGFDDGHHSFGGTAASRHYPVYLLPLCISRCGYNDSSMGESMGEKAKWLVKGLIVSVLDQGKFGPDTYVRMGTFSLWPGDELQRSEQWVEALWSCLPSKTISLL